MNINVSYASSNSFIRHVAVSLTSLLAHNKEDSVTVYLIENGVESENIEAIKKIVEGFQQEIHIISASELERKFQSQLDLGLYNIATLIRLFLGSLLPKEVSRIIHIDSDTTVLGSLREYWETDLGEAMAGAVVEVIAPKSVKRKVGLEKQDNYFNAGIFLADLDKWRKQEVEQKFIHFYERMGGKLVYCDQDVINGVLKGRILPVDPKFNLVNYWYQYPYYALKHFAAGESFYSKEQVKNAVQHPVIVHYAGEDRPWKRGNKHPYEKYYKHYLSKTIWRDTPDETGKETYFKIYYLFMKITSICPVFRRWLLYRMLPLVLAIRKNKRNKKTN